MTPEEKIKYLPAGPWIDEPDELYFNHKGIDCKISRILAFENNGRIFGGHCCGYCKIPELMATSECFEQSTTAELGFSVHGGITYSEFAADGCWIGFDCAHSGDIVPSMLETKRRIREELQQKLIGWNLSPFSKVFIDEYRDINFVRKECESLAEQIIDYFKYSSTLPLE